MLGAQLDAQARAVPAQTGEQVLTFHLGPDALHRWGDVFGGDDLRYQSGIHDLFPAVANDLTQAIIALDDDTLIVNGDALERGRPEHLQALPDFQCLVLLCGARERRAQRMPEERACAWAGRLHLGSSCEPELALSTA